MSRYLFIESRDPHESPDAAQTAELASQLSKGGDEVTVFLVQNAVFGARAKAKAPAFAPYSDAPKLSVLVDDFSLGERGIETSELRAGYTLAPIDRLVELLVADDLRAIWS